MVKGGLSTKVFHVAKSELNEKVLCPLTGWLAFLASSRKGSGALPDGRVEGLRCFTIRKANGKIKKGSRMAAFLRSHSLSP